MKPASKPHDSAIQHVTGESIYVDDRAPQRGEVYVDVIFSTIPHGKVKKINFEKALKEKNIIAGFTGEDFHLNLWGTIFKDQPILASDVVGYAGEPIALLVGSDLVSVQFAKKLVEIEYEEFSAILSIDEAIEQKSFIADAREIVRGEFQENYEKSPHQLSGQLKIQGADHFYLESQATIVYPLEDGQFEVHSSSQHPTETQHVVAHALGVPDSDVVCVVKRMGGGFGGKESQAAPFAAMAALVSQKLGVPARIALTKDDDMIMTGKRNPFQNDYWVGFDEQGMIQALKVNLYSDSGAYADLSTAIMERAMLHSDNAYFIPHMEIRGQVCKTNFHPHTAFRGFGGPKGVATIERIIEEIAFYLNTDALEIRKKNLYRPGFDMTHYGQEVENNCLERLFSGLEKSSDYQKRRSRVSDLNKKDSEWTYGLSMTAVKFGISFTTRFLNQANAMVIVHQDGSLQVATGATEMGQGVNARIADLVASELGLPRERARMMPTRTDKNANTSPTAASSGTDLNGAAALLATRKIKKRLSEFAMKLFEVPASEWATKTAGLGTAKEIELETPHLDENDPNRGADWDSGKAGYFDIIFEDEHVYHKNHPERKLSFSALVVEAYLNRISLSDYAHYKIPGIEFNKITGSGNAFLYFTQGVASSEVKVNRDTGEVKVLATDILMDLGRPINEALDLGQVSGAFIQGMGWVTSENLYYNEKGFLVSHAPSTYKIPNVQDLPRHYQIKLLENDENYANIRGTKAVGEPPLLLAISVWTAIQNALSYQRESFPNIKIPATNEECLRALYPEEFQELPS